MRTSPSRTSPRGLPVFASASLEKIPRVEVRPLDPSEYDAAAVVLADAFLDDPGWVAVGPDRRERRHRLLRRFHRDALDIIHRYGRPIYGAFGEDGTLVGVAATFAAGLYPPPALRTTLRF